MSDPQTKRSVRILLVAMFCCLFTQIGCARSPSPADEHPSKVVSHRSLSSEDAAVLAARLANKECEQRYKRQPFKAGQHVAILRAGFYRWAKLDVGGVGGFSAVVSFRQDGSEPQVEVYFSSDTLVVK